MNYIGLNKYDTANGDGIRVSLFVSGCSVHCKGCFNSEAWDFGAGQPFTEKTKAEIIEALNQDYIDGFSLLGGDPFETAHELILTDLLYSIRKECPDKSIWAWTGRKFDDIKYSPLMQYIDVLIDGPFIEAKKDSTLKYRGSSNQQIHNIKQMNMDFVKDFMAVLGVIQSGLYTLLEITEQHKVNTTPDNYSEYIKEEYREFIAEKDGTPEQYKELCDLIWTCIQKANKQHYDLAKGMAALVDEYTSKFYTADGVFKPIYRDDGKLLKNTGFKKADFNKLFNKETR